jgi:hypothetical protein
MLSFNEATTNPIFPPLNFVEFSLQFGRGPYLKDPYDIVCVEADAHGGVLKVEVTGLMLILNSTTRISNRRHEFRFVEKIMSPLRIAPASPVTAAGSDGRRNTGLQFTGGSFEA